MNSADCQEKENHEKRKSTPNVEELMGTMFLPRASLSHILEKKFQDSVISHIFFLIILRVKNVNHVTHIILLL